MKLNTILLPIDFSATSQSAINYASALAKEAGAKLLIFHAEEPPAPFVGEGVYIPPTTHANPEITRMLEAVQPAREGISVERIHRIGNAADEIVRLADERNVDLIVMGTHGRKGLDRFLMGSVAELVVRKAACPVLTLRDRHIPKEEDAKRVTGVEVRARDAP